MIIGENLFIICTFLISEIISYKKIKVVKEPSSLSYENFNPHFQLENEINKLKVTVESALFPGPPHFNEFKGKCFQKVIGKYLYNVCPFNNITQHEQKFRWNTFNAVLGVWKEWIIENNTFVGLSMPNGDKCMDDFRYSTIQLSCHNVTEVLNVTEEEKCKYTVVMGAQIFCNEDVFLVYPTLSEHLQLKWDLLESHLLSGQLTLQGYNKEHRKIMVEAKYLIGDERNGSNVSNRNISTNIESFENLSSCQKAYENIYKELIKQKSQ